MIAEGMLAPRADDLARGFAFIPATLLFGAVSGGTGLFAVLRADDRSVLVRLAVGSALGVAGFWLMFALAAVVAPPN